MIDVERRHIEGVLGEVVARTGFRDAQTLFDGRPVDWCPRTATEHRLAVGRLSLVLYERWFTRAGITRTEADTRGPASRTPAPHDNLVARLRLARQGGAGVAGVRRDGIDDSGSWWMAWSSQPAPHDPHRVRVYWHCPPAAVERLVAHLTARLESAGSPYLLKCPTTQEQFSRTDALVLYLALPWWTRVRASLRDVHAVLETMLDEGTPPLTRRLGRGVAVAEDPGRRLSFGQSRSRAVASGLLMAAEGGVTAPDDIVALVLAEFPRHDISARQPHVRSTTSVSPDTWMW